MNIEEITKEVTTEYNATLQMLEALPVDTPIRSITRGLIHLEHCTYSENMDLLHSIRETIDCTLKHYFTSCGVLCIVYTTPYVEILMPCTDQENALERVSQGKCTLETKTHTETTTEVVCNL